MRKLSTIFVLTIVIMQISSAQDFSKVDKIAAELKKSLQSLGVNDAKHETEATIAMGKNEREEPKTISHQEIDTVLTETDKPNHTKEVEISTSVNTQVKFGVDLYSRYIWRGLDYGNAPSFQPALSYTIGGFSIGTWAAYSVGVFTVDSSGVGKIFAEHDLWASYAISTDAGTFSLFYTDYFYPSAGLKYFDFNKTGGAHVLEFGAGFTGNDKLPLMINAYYNFYNDPDHSVYLQFCYVYSGESYSANVFAAFTPAKSVWYGTTKADLVNVGVTVSKSIVITDKFSLPLTISYIINPHIEQTYLIVGITL